MQFPMPNPHETGQRLTRGQALIALAMAVSQQGYAMVSKADAEELIERRMKDADQ